MPITFLSLKQRYVSRKLAVSYVFINKKSKFSKTRNIFLEKQQRKPPRKKKYMQN